MIVNLRLDLDDGDRQVLANFLDGRATKRLATRNDVREFLEGALAAAVDDAVLMDPEPSPSLAANSDPGSKVRESFTAAEIDEIERLREDRYPDSYIRGWIRVARKSGRLEKRR